MKRKIIIVSILALLLSIVAGAVSPSVERWWAERGIPPGQKVVKRLSDYYEAELFDRLLAQAGEERDKEENAEYRPQILYIEWVAERRVETEERKQRAESRKQKSRADEVKEEFLQKYPDHLLAADMHFADAMMMLANAEYDAAAEKLRMIEEKWPDAKVTMRAREIRGKLENRKEDQPQRHSLPPRSDPRGDTEVAPRRVPD